MGVLNRLDLSDPYQRAVAYEALDVVALNPTLSFKYFEIYDATSKQYNSLNLTKFRSSLLNNLTAESKNDLLLLHAIAKISKDSEMVNKMFNAFDKDNSGHLDIDEFQYLLKKLGFDSSDEKVSAIMSTLDADGEGVINLDECTEYIFNVGMTALEQIKEIESYPMFGSNNNQNIRYIPPDRGIIRLEIIESFNDANEIGCLSKEQCKYLLDAVERTSDPSLMLEYGMDLSNLYLDEAGMVFSKLSQYEDVKVLILSKIIPRMATTLDANTLVKIHLGNESKANRHLKKALGWSYHPLLGMFNGYYILDLVKESDRVCLHKLIEQSMINQTLRKTQNKWDISQNGNWSCFRNVRVAGRLVSQLQPEKYSPMPRKGKLEFDFVDFSRPNHEIDRPISDNKVIQVLYNCYLIRSPSHKRYISNKLKELHYNNKYSISEYNNGFNYSSDTNRMLIMFDYLQKMYKSLDVRYESYEKSFKREIYAEKQNTYISVDDDSTTDGKSVKSSSILGIIKNDNDNSSNTSVVNRQIQDSDEISVLSVATTRKSIIQTPRKVSIISSILDRERLKLNSTNATQSITARSSIVSTSSNGNGNVKKSPRRSSVMTIDNKHIIEYENADKEREEEERLELEKLEQKRQAAELIALTYHNNNKKNNRRNSELSKINENVIVDKESDIDNDSKSEDQNAIPHVIPNPAFRLSDKGNTTKSTNLALSKRFKNILDDPNASPEYQSSVLLQYLITQFLSRWMEVKQFVIILELFNVGCVQKTILGSYRVEFIVVLFGRILDLQNFCNILAVLTAEEHAAVIARLGWLSVFNPCKPDGCYRLDLSHWEERQIAKMLIHLSLIEPGQRWKDEQFTFANQAESMPG